jgi:putative peptide-modifying radical SAM enzyme
MNEFDNGLDKKFDYDMSVPVNSNVQVDELKKFLESDDTLIFYGGEPLIMADKVKEIMDNVNCRFCMQSNGILLNKLPKKYLKKIDKMLLSIDGNKEQTDFNRGKGSYDTLMKNISETRKSGYKGEIVARMTLSFPNIYEQVMHLTKLINEGVFDSVHWQIDAGFYKNDFDKKKFSDFVREYNVQIDNLLDFWVYEIGKGKVWKFYPFLGIFDTIYYGKKSLLPCGSGHSNFTINTSGKLSACPIMNSVKNFYCGNLTTPENKIKKIKIYDSDCSKCNYFNVCGGRCLYWKEAKLWPREGDKLICKTIIHLIEGIEKRIPKIKKFIDDGIIRKEDFEFEKYFGPEIIP